MTNTPAQYGQPVPALVPPPRYRPQRAGWLWLVVVLCAVCADTGVAEAERLRAYPSKHYAIETALSRKETRPLARHMDRIFAAYHDKFQDIGLEAKRAKPMALYLFRTQKQYLRFLAKHEIDGTNTGGMFIYRRQLQGLATFTQGRSVTETFAVLQHEGFHQFAFHYIGPELPIWVNEGLAQYFEDGIFVRGKLQLDLANAERIASVKAALKERRAIDFERMLSITSEQWSEVLKTDPAEARLLYDQAWSMAFFLVTTEQGRRARPFHAYLKAVAKGRSSAAAFRTAFDIRDTASFERQWRKYARSAEPDAINVALWRLGFLGQALRVLTEQKMDRPRDIDDLRRTLRKVRFRAVRTSHGLTTEMSAMDDSFYEYPVGRRRTRKFQLLERSRNDLPPRITAPGLKPEPTLVWSRNAEGELVQDVEFK